MTEKKAPGKKATSTKPKTKLTVIQPEVLAATFDDPQRAYKKIRLVNIGLAAAFALQAVAMLVFGHGRSLPVSLGYLTTDPLQTAAQGTTVRALATHHLFDVNVLAVAVTVLFVAALLYALLATAYRQRFETEVAAGNNRLRWFGYAITTALLTLAVAMVLGVQDVALLLVVVTLCVIQNLAGWMVERHDLAGATRQKLGIAVGGLAGLSSLAIPGLYLYGATMDGTATPGYFYGLFAVSALAFITFSLTVMVHHRHVGKWSDHLFAEQTYMVLYLLITSALAWQLFAGTR